MSGVKGRSGRKRKDVEHRNTRQIINGSAIHAARVIAEVVRGTRRRISISRLRAAFFIIEQAIGKAPQRIEMEHSGTLTYKQLSEKASDILKEAEQILAEKTQQDVAETSAGEQAEGELRVSPDGNRDKDTETPPEATK